MLQRDKTNGRLLKQPAKIGDWIVAQFPKHFNTAYLGLTQNKAYKVVATQNSAEKNRISFGSVFPKVNKKRTDKFGVFIMDDDGCKRFVRLGTDCFGITWEKLPS